MKKLCIRHKIDDKKNNKMRTNDVDGFVFPIPKNHLDKHPK